MIILGVDPGLRMTGYGIIQLSQDFLRTRKMDLLEAGVLKTQESLGIAGRLRQIYEPLGEIIDEFQPERLIIEKLFAHYKHPATAILMGHARGIICLLSAVKNVPLTSLPSTRVKKSVTGKGHANKEQIQKMVCHYLGVKCVKDMSSDASDALAIAIAYAFSLKRASA